MTSSCAVWDFRANENLYQSETLLKFLRSNAKKYAFQLEQGDTGYRHWQGRISLIKKRNKSQLLKLFEAMLANAPNYLEPTSKANHNEAFFYALKEDTRVGEIFADEGHKKILGINEVYIPRQFRNKVLYPYQQFILDSANVPEDRKINVIVDPVGNRGKSFITAIAELMHDAIDIPMSLDFKELIGAVCNICMDRGTRNPKLMFFDMPRAVDKRVLSGLYSALEQIKKGKLYDFRHHYKYWWIDSPQIWVFTNQEPPRDLLSADRWNIYCINEKNSLMNYADSIVYTKADRTEVFVKKNDYVDSESETDDIVPRRPIEPVGKQLNDRIPLNNNHFNEKELNTSCFQLPNGETYQIENPRYTLNIPYDELPKIKEEVHEINIHPKLMKQIKLKKI